MTKHKLVLLIVLTALGPMIWGSTYIVTSEILPANKPFISAFIRGAPAGLLLIMLSRSLPQPQEWGKLLILSLLNIGCFQAMLFIAAYKLPGGLAAVIGAIQPLIVLSFMWCIDKVKPALFTFYSCLASFIGMGLLILSPSTTLDNIGVLAAFTGAFSMGAGTFLAKKWRTSLSIMGFTGWQLLLGSLSLTPLVIWLDFPLPTLSNSQLFAYFYLSFFGAVIAYFLWFNGIKHLSPVAVSALGLLSPLTASALGWLFSDEKLTGLSLIGFVMVLVSVLYVQKPTKSHQ